MIAKTLARNQFYQEDFSAQDLSGQDLSHAVFHNCNFDNANLSDANCEGSDFIGSSFKATNCRGTNFKDAKLAATVFKPSDCYGMTLTMDCKTFENMAVNQIWFYSLLVLLASMLPDAYPVKENLTDRLIAMIGSERYVRIKSMLQRREI